MREKNLKKYFFSKINLKHQKLKIWFTGFNFLKTWFKNCARYIFFQTYVKFVPQKCVDIAVEQFHLSGRTFIPENPEWHVVRDFGED